MSKSSELDQKVKLYILSCIDNSGYNDKILTTSNEKIDFLRSTFEGEQQWHIDHVGYQNAMTNYLQGLASSLTIEFSDYKILELAILWGSIPKNHTDKQANKILDNYWNFMAGKTCQLLSGYHIPKLTESN